MHQIKWQQLTISRLCADFGWSILREDCGLLAKSFAVEDSKIPERCLASRIWPGFLPRGWISDNGNMIPIAAAGAQCQCLDGIHFTTWMCMFNLEFSKLQPLHLFWHLKSSSFGGTLGPPLGMHGIGLAGWASYIVCLEVSRTEPQNCGKNKNEPFICKPGYN